MNALLKAISCVILISVAAVSAKGNEPGEQRENGKPVNILQIKDAWTVQAKSSDTVEIATSITVDISQSFMDAMAEDFRKLGRKLRPAPRHREENVWLILQGSRALIERKVNGEKDTAFFNGREYRSLSEPVEGSSHVVITSRKSDLRSSPLLAELIVFRGLDEGVSGIRFDDFRVVKTTNASVTMLFESDDTSHILELDRRLGFMPVEYSRVRRTDGKKFLEVKINYRDGQISPYVPDNWAVVEFHSTGVITNAGHVTAFSTTPTIDLTTYEINIPQDAIVTWGEGTTPDKRIASMASGRFWMLMLTACLIVVLLLAIILKNRPSPTGEQLPAST